MPFVVPNIILDLVGIRKRTGIDRFTIDVNPGNDVGFGTFFGRGYSKLQFQYISPL